MRLTLITATLVALLLPVGLAQADTWIEDFAVISDIVPGENTVIMVTVGYDFTSQVQLNPGIFSFEADDWIVETLDPVNGKGTENYTLEFPTPSEDGEYYYQANVWYTKNSRWFFDGVDAAHNFTIHVGEEDITQIEEFVSILQISKPESLNISSRVDLNITIHHSYINLTEISINVHNSESEIIAEEFDSLEGVGTRNYHLSFISPSEAGIYTYRIDVESETVNSSIATSQVFSIETIDDEEEDIPQIEEYVNIFELTTPESLNVSSTVDLNMIIQHSFINWTAVRVYVQNATSEIIFEESESWSGEGAEDYSLSFVAPSEAGTYSYTVYIESVSNSSIASSQGFEIETIAPIVEPSPSRGIPVYILVPVILVVAFVVYQYGIKED